MDLVRDFSERDPRDESKDNPWKNPQSMLEQLHEARAKIVAAWGTNDDNNNNNNNNNNNKAAQDDDSDKNIINSNNNNIRAAYMDMVTDAFADVLEDMRKNGSSNEEELDVDILVDCLQSGMDFMSGEERDMLLMEMEDDNEGIEDEGDEDKLTPHEERRQQLGLQAC